MTRAKSKTYDESQIADEFSKVQMLFNNIKEEFFAGNDNFNILSVSISNNYLIAIKFGSNHIKVGSKIVNNQ